MKQMLTQITINETKFVFTDSHLDNPVTFAKPPFIHE
jgi:hypothetical protein